MICLLWRSYLPFLLCAGNFIVYVVASLCGTIVLVFVQSVLATGGGSRTFCDDVWIRESVGRMR